VEYSGYRGAVLDSAGSRFYPAGSSGIDDLVNLEGADVAELKESFHEAVETARLDHRSFAASAPA